MSPETRNQRNLSHEVAAALGAGWDVKPDPRWGVPGDAPLDVVGPRGEILYVNSVYRDETRWFAKGKFPKFIDGVVNNSDSDHMVGVSRNRGIKAFVEAIQKRLLPAYQEALPAVLATFDEAKANDAQRLANFQELQSILGRYVSLKSPNREATSPLQQLSFSHLPDAYGDIEVLTRNATVHLRYAPIELVKDIARLIREYADRRAKI